MIRLAGPRFSESTLEDVSQILREGRLVQGPTVARFEDALSERLGNLPVVVVSSGTAALHLALLAAGIGPGDEVIVPAFTFAATANAVVRCGARPVPVDIGLHDYGIDPAGVSAALSPRTRAIMPVHEFGQSADWGQLRPLAEAAGIPLLEDAACALGATWEGRACGALGHLGCFSFHPRKTITTGEGGAVCCSQEALASELRLLRSHGMTFNGGRRDVVVAGLNSRMTEFQATLGLAQIPSLDEEIATRREQAERYREALAGLPLSLPGDLPGRPHSFQTYHVLLDSRLDRAAVIGRLARDGVESGAGAQSLAGLSFYRDNYGWQERDFPVARRASAQGLALPVGTHMTQLEQDQVVSALVTALRWGEGSP